MRRDAERRRRCIGCRRSLPVDGLLRFVLTDGRPQVGRLPGRGAWICAWDDECLRRAASRDRLRRAFRVDVSDGAAEELVSAVRGASGPKR